MPIVWQCVECGANVVFTKFGALIPPGWDWTGKDVVCAACVDILDPTDPGVEVTRVERKPKKEES